MTPRTRRFAEVIAAAVVVLFIGRWTAEFVAERWWAGTVAPDAARFVTSYALLGVALDAMAIVAASVWFALHALVVARAIASVQVTRRLGDLQLREAVPTKVLLWGAVISGVLLGLIAGADAHVWRDPIMLAWTGVRYGVEDPLLHQDIGVLVGQLPMWELVHQFTVLLVLLGTAFSMTLYGGIGAIRIEGRRLLLHADARRHLGVLFACIAVVIAFGYMLAPYHLAAAELPAMSLSAGLRRVHAANVLAGVSIAAMLASIAWSLRGNNTYLLAGWIVLAVAAVGERVAVPAMSDAAPAAPSRLAAIRHFDALAWGIREVTPSVPADTIPPVTALWDSTLLSRLLDRTGGRLVAATPLPMLASGTMEPTWLIATPAITDSTQLDVLAVRDGATTATGGALFLSAGEPVPGARPSWRTVTDPRSRPDAPAWRGVANGVNGAGPLRRLLLAWARQAPGMLVDPVNGAFDWHLDPVERAAAILPMVAWDRADLALPDGRLTWLVQGMLPIEHFPLAVRQQWQGAEIAGLVPAFVAAVDGSTGAVRFYLDPAADSLGAAWARAIGPLIEPSSSLSPGIRDALGYSADWLEAQATVLRSAAWNGGHASYLHDEAQSPATVWVNGLTAGEQIVMGEATSAAGAMVATGYRVRGTPQLRVEQPVSDETSRGPWGVRAPMLTHLRDSVIAAGDSVAFRPIRWFAGHDAIARWQPVFAVPRQSAPVLLWVQTLVGDIGGGGVTPAEGWDTVRHPDRLVGSQGPDDATVLDEARQWVARADSAIRRGDLTAFGRAFEALRSTLQRPPH